MSADRDGSGPELAEAPWLAAARAQSRELAEARARRPQLNFVARPHRAMMGALMLTAASIALAITSIAWAWLAHRRGGDAVVPAARLELREPMTSRAVPVLRTIPRASTVASPRPRRMPAPIATSTTGDYIEPDGEVIFVRPRVSQPPLFDAKEYKSRGVLVHEPQH
jgi:hypothetical protein